MPDDSFQLLKDLIAAPSPSGYEQPAAEVFKRGCAPFADRITTDITGNSYAILNPEGGRTVMLAGHCDEIGFLITYIHPGGYLYFDPLGGHDANIAVGQRVLVHTAEHGSIPGVIGKKPIHMLSEEERKRTTQIAELFIDVGASSDVDVAEMVRIGDPITYAAPFERLAGDLAAAHGFDNKIGAYVVAEAARLVAERGGLKATSLHAVATVQEEVGHRGATTAAHKVNAEIGIAVDVGHATDYPGADKRHVGDVRCGNGPIIMRGTNMNPEVFRRLVAAAEAEEIAFQVAARPGGTRTDANALQLNRDGMATGLISIPLRYMHSPCEVVALSDITNAARLIARFVLDIGADTDFTPSMANLAAPRLPAQKSADLSRDR